MKNLKRIFEFQEINQPIIKKFDVYGMVKTINTERNLDILSDLVDLIDVRMTTQQDITEYYQDNDNMKLYPKEIVETDDFETLNMIKGMIANRIKKIESGEADKEPIEVGFIKHKKEKTKEDKRERTIGFVPHLVQTEPSKPRENKYKGGTHLGFMKEFREFINEARKRDIKKEILKELSKKKREERLASGAKLTTKVVPDKKKNYKRQDAKKVNLEED